MLLKKKAGPSLAVQRLRLHTSTSGSAGSIPGQGAKISHATWRDQKIKKKKKASLAPCGPTPPPLHSSHLPPHHTPSLLLGEPEDAQNETVAK